MNFPLPLTLVLMLEDDATQSTARSGTSPSLHDATLEAAPDSSGPIPRSSGIFSLSAPAAPAAVSVGNTAQRTFRGRGYRVA